jgi:hypothetical protein
MGLMKTVEVEEDYIDKIVEVEDKAKDDQYTVQLEESIHYCEVRARTGFYYSIQSGDADQQVDEYSNSNSLTVGSPVSSPSSPSSPPSSSQSLHLYRKVSEAAITDNFLEKYYWNEKFQELLEKPVTNTEEGHRYLCIYMHIG